jgi:hypothetical protein
VSRIPFDDGILSTTMDGSYAVTRPLAPLPFAIGLPRASLSAT